MSRTLPETWCEDNQRYLTRAIAEVRLDLERFYGENAGELAGNTHSAAGMTIQPALELLCSAFGLSSFERKVLLMCAGAEMDSSLAARFAALGNQSAAPTFSLALAAFEDAHWSALSPDRPLRYWNLVEVLGGDTLTTGRLRIQERVLHYLAGLQGVDERLQAFVKAARPPEMLPPSQQVAARQTALNWIKDRGANTVPIIQLCGEDPAAKRAIAATAATMAGLQLHTLSIWNLPRAASEINALVRLWERESVLSSSALLLECDEADHADTASSAPIHQWMETLRSPLVISTRAPLRCRHRGAVLLDVDKPTVEEQVTLWRGLLERSFPNLNGEVDSLVSQFSLSPATIQSVAEQATATIASEEAASGGEEKLADRLWDACRVQARPQIEALAQRIEADASWEDLVLPEKQKQVLQQIAIHLRQRTRVYHTWGFAAKSSRGLGLSALFAGPSGTGKTMAAEVLARDLRLDLYKIDLSQVVSKYIGETEKNLRRVFDAAEDGAAVLLFDEADALFGKRTEVKDSHDRYANIEVSYLLQRMEAYRGLAILTTNRKNSLDQAFLRRLRFVVEFPFPEPAQRAEIWRRVFPAATPTEDLRIDRLARLTAAGGNIRNIALGAAFLAADAGEPVRMSHLLSAARSEFAKLEKPLTDAEIAGWA